MCFYHLAECDKTHKSSGRNETQGKLQRLLDRGRGEWGGGGGDRGGVRGEKESVMCECVCVPSVLADCPHPDKCPLQTGK